ncbi:MAG: LuxR C-terminal-related transcriptional regulator [Hydrogenophaga sp.]
MFPEESKAYRPWVLVVEDEARVARKVCEAIDRDRRMKLSGWVRTAAEAQRWLTDGRRSVDVLLIDLGLPDRSGLEVIESCRLLRPSVDIMVSTVFHDEQHVLGALEIGAAGYLLKSDDAQEIADHVMTLHHGGSPITPSVARMVLHKMRTPSPKSAAVVSPGKTEERLTARETEVLNLIAVGYSTLEISDRLNISSHTVTTHIRSVYRKLQVHTRNAAVFEAKRQQLLYPYSQ